MSTEIYCCKDFLTALNDYTIMYSDEIGCEDNKYHLHGSDEGEYPPLNFCPACGKKVVHFKPTRHEYDGHIIGAYPL